MRVDAAVSAAASKLRRSKNFTPQLDAEVILAWVLGVTREHLATYPEGRLTPPQWKRFRRLIKRREGGVPVAYLTGHKEFFGLDLLVNRYTLIPRPETEALVEAILPLATKKRTAAIADIGTGSGNLAIALARHLPHATVFAVDRSRGALAVARRNAKRHCARVHFRRGDLLSPLTRVRLDIVAANLPYLPDAVYREKHRQLRHEPALALRSGVDGLGHYRRLLAQLAARPQRPRHILLEADATQLPALRLLVHSTLPHVEFSHTIVNSVGVVRLTAVSKKTPRVAAGSKIEGRRGSGRRILR